MVPLFFAYPAQSTADENSTAVFYCPAQRERSYQNWMARHAHMNTDAGSMPALWEPARRAGAWPGRLAV